MRETKEDVFGVYTIDRREPELIYSLRSPRRAKQER